MGKNVTKETFKGDGSFPNPEDGVNWQLGYDHGLQYALSNYTLGKRFDPFPGDSNKGWFGNGFAEGVISGRSRIIDRDYPNWSSISLCSQSGVIGDGSKMWYEIIFKDGTRIKVDCQK